MTDSPKNSPSSRPTRHRRVQPHEAPWGAFVRIAEEVSLMHPDRPELKPELVRRLLEDRIVWKLWDDQSASSELWKDIRLMANTYGFELSPMSPDAA